MKKILAFLMAFIFLTGSFSVTSYANDSDTATVTVLEDIFTRSGSVHGANVQSSNYLVVDAGRTSYLKFDVTSLKKAMNGNDARYLLQITSHASSANGDIMVYGITGESRTAWSENSLSYNKAYELGLDTDETMLLGNIKVTAKNTMFTFDVTEYILALPEDGIATIKLQNKGSSAVVMVQTKEFGTAATLTASRTYAEGTEAVFDGISFPEPVTENIVLPTTGAVHGSTISWESSHPDVISADGTVTRQSENVVVTLTATYVGYSNIRKSYDVTVLKAGGVSECDVTVMEDTFTRSGIHGGTVQGNNILVVDESRTTYLKFDVNELKSDMDGNNAKYTLQFTSHAQTNMGDVNIYGISGVNRTSWTEDSLYYDMAYELGLDGDVSELIATIGIISGNEVLSIDVTDYVLSVPDDGIAVFKLQNKTISGALPLIIQSKEGGSAARLSASISMTEDFYPVGDADAEKVIMQNDFNNGSYENMVTAGNPVSKVVNGEPVGADSKVLQVTKTGGDFWNTYTPSQSYKTGIQHMSSDFYIPSGEITGGEYLVMAVNCADGRNCTGFWVEFSEGKDGQPVGGYGKVVTDYPRDSWFTLHYTFDYYKEICEVSLIHNNTVKTLHRALMSNTTFMTDETGGLRQFRIGGKADDMKFYNDNIRVYEDIRFSSETVSGDSDVSVMLDLDYEIYDEGISAPPYESLNYQANGGRALVVADPDDENNNVLMLQQDSYNAAIAYWDCGVLSGKNVFSARIRTDDENGNKYIQLRAGSLNVPSLLEISEGRLRSMGIDIGRCETGKWYDFVASFDREEQTVVVYLDGKPVRYANLGSEFSAAEFTRFDIRTTGWYANRTSLYVDNIHHYKFGNSNTGAIVSLYNEYQNKNCVRLSFTNQMCADTVITENISVKNASDYVVSYNDSRFAPHTACIYFETPLEEGTEYEITFNNVKDIFGNNLTAEPVSFTVTDSDITISDYLKMLLDNLGISYTDEVEKAYELGIVDKGSISDKNLPILKKQAVSMVLRSITDEYYSDLSAFEANIKDISSVEDVYKTDVVRAYSEGIADLYAGYFGADAYVSLCEAEDIIFKALNPEARVAPLKPAPKFSLLSLFGDNMVLQRGEVIPVYGSGTDGEEICVEIAGVSAVATVENGAWRAELKGVPTGGPYRLKISGSEAEDTLIFENVLVGDVWIVSGQSNAALMTFKSMDWNENKLSANNPDLRLFTQSLRPTSYEKTDTTGTWFETDSATAGDFSAVGYYFADKLQRDTGVPIGIINASKSGSSIDFWLPEGSVPDGFETEAATQYYNGMISSLTDFPISGVVWYQGESNAKEEYKELYEDALTELISVWRDKWEKDFPFLIVQLPPYTGADLPLYHYVRESCLNIVNKVKNVGMVPTSDIELGGTDPLHPTNKKPVGERLALLAEGMSYGYDGEYSMPLYQNTRFVDNKAIVTFAHTGTGLTSDGELTGFRICGADKVFVDATAEIVGDTIHVYNENVQNPVAVRYFFEAVTEGINLYNSAGLPASPFRSDSYIDCYKANLTNADGSKIESLTVGADVVAKVELTNNNSKKGKSGIFVAVAEYSSDGKSLGNVVTADVDIQAGETNTIQLPLTVKNGDGIFKVFVWENHSSLAPIRAFVPEM